MALSKFGFWAAAMAIDKPFRTNIIVHLSYIYPLRYCYSTLPNTREYILAPSRPCFARVSIPAEFPGFFRIFEEATRFLEIIKTA